MKRSGYIQRRTPIKTYTRIKHKSASDTATLKEEIQRLVREIVIARDGGCILQDIPGLPACNGYTKAGELILQADHLIERSNSATYADTRLIVCVCKAHHGWKHFKKSNHDEYDAIVRTLISPERVVLWDRCEQESWRPKEPLKIGFGNWLQ